MRLMQGDYYRDLDYLRAVLMVIGIVIHAAQLYNPAAHWVVEDQQSSFVMAVIVDSIIAFRMPTFFIMAGFFTALMWQRYSPYVFVKKRLLRLAVPLIVTALTLNTLQQLVLLYFGQTTLTWPEYWRQGSYIQHLWFLVNLLVYIALFVLCRRVLNASVWAFLNQGVERLGRLPLWLGVGGFPLLFIGFYGANKLGFPLYSFPFGVFNVHSMVMYLPYFVLGCVIFTYSGLLNQIRAVSLRASGAGILFAVSAMLCVPSHGVVGTVLSVYLKELVAILSAVFLIRLFFRLGSVELPVLSRISQASMTLYLFHHSIVVLQGCLLLNVPVNLWLKFTFIVVATYLLCFLIYHRVISRNRWLSLAFTGKRALPH